MKRTSAKLFVVLLLIYIVLVFSLPTNPEILEKYSITQFEARLLNIAIITPLIAVYLSALYGFIRINDYAKSVKDSKEGTYFNNLSNGIAWLAFSLPVSGIINSLLSYLAYRRPDLLPTTVIIRNYVTLIFIFISILLIAKACQGLYETLKKKVEINRYFTLLLPIVLASIYSWLITSQNHENHDQQGYYLPEWLAILTVAIPYTLVWCAGIIAALQLNRYQQGVKGTIYKRALKHLSLGVGMVVIISIFLQFLTTLSEQLNRLNLTPLLIIIYILIFMYALGFGLIARGANRLKQIEEV